MRRHRRVAALGATTGLAIAAVALAPACGNGPVVVAIIPLAEAGPTPCTVSEASDGGAASDGEGGAAPCPIASQYCEPTVCCEGTACKGMPGTCQSPPQSCGNEYSPVCGCDGVTYFNDCLRQSGRVQAAGPGMCSVSIRPIAQFCFDGAQQPCAQGTLGTATCAKVVPNQSDLMDLELLFGKASQLQFICGFANAPVSFCWVLPKTQPSGDGGQQGPFVLADLTSCASTGAAKLLTMCTDAYSALTSGSVLVESTNCH